MADFRFDIDPDCGVAGKLCSAGRDPGQPASPSAAVSPPVLFTVPRIRRDWIGETLRLKPPLDVACREAVDRPSSDFSLAVQRLLQSVIHNRRSSMPKIMFVSERDKLGATVLAVNFAQIAAKAGYRTLLIEANRQHPVIASLMSPDVRTNLIDLLGVRRVLCQLSQDLAVIPLLDAQSAALFEARAHHCVKGIKSHFDLIVLDGGTFVEDDDMKEMVAAVDQVFCLTPQGLELFGSSVDL